MEYNIGKREIVLNRKLSNLDKFVLDFCKLLEEYVIVSGYVSILFGRSRATEDVDLLVPKMNEDRFLRVWKKIHNSGFECLNTSKPGEAFGMLNEHAIRFSKINEPRPNMEFKVIKTDLDRYSYENRMRVTLKSGELFVSPFEMQIAFKLLLAGEGQDKELASDKDIEDARFLYKLFREKLNKEEFITLLDKLNVREKLKWLE
ncbi:MAG: hypothetical protein WDZ69_03525 [Candidatus Pacearchaeota archaeon]